MKNATGNRQSHRCTVAYQRTPEYDQWLQWTQHGRQPGATVADCEAWRDAARGRIATLADCRLWQKDELLHHLNARPCVGGDHAPTPVDDPVGRPPATEDWRRAWGPTVTGFLSKLAAYGTATTAW